MHTPRQRPISGDWTNTPPQRSDHAMPYLKVSGPGQLAAIQANANERAKMPVTNVHDLISSLKGEIQSAKSEGEDAVNNVRKAVASFRESSDAVKRVAKEINQEAALLVASVSEFTNGGPPLEEGK